MRNTTVLISGAGIAGPALAHWLIRYGFAVTVVERAPSLRRGGQAVDFKGETHRTVLGRMGILDDVRRLQTGGDDIHIVDAHGRTLAVIPHEFSGGDIEILRGDLARLLYERTAPTCEYVFGDSITSLTETGDGVHVTFERSAPRTFDLVVGADGIHSNVRRLAFGPEAEFVRFLGHYYALVETGLDFGDPPKMYNEPGRMVTVGGPKAPAFFVFASGPLAYDRSDVERQKRLLERAYAGMGWRVPEVMELAAAGGDHRVAFAEYERLMRPYAKIAKNGNAGAFLAPGTPAKIRMRNRTFRYGFLFGLLMKLTDRFATDIELKTYPATVG